MLRKIIQIDEDKCTGCGICVDACHEGAIGLVNGKAKLMRDDYCDGLGDCLPTCPTGAISFIEKDTVAYDEEAVKKNMEERVNNFVKKQVNEGRQAYIVCPLVEENEEMDLKSVEELTKKYKEETFSEYKVEYLHGKMKAKEKDTIMEKFKNGEIDILISTTVIEVGVNVPNASIMVVENAERFGLAQLHQLRGRVGRGEYQSYCILKYEGNGKVVQERMKIMTSTNDGFIISEKDLELRGSGEFFGTKQHGLPEFKIANLFEDIEMLKMVQSLAIRIIEKDEKLEKPENKLLNKMVEKKFKDRIEI